MTEQEIRDQLTRREGEDLKEYRFRVCQAKQDYNLSWIDITAIINNNLGTKSTPNTNANFYHWNKKRTKSTELDIKTEKMYSERVRLSDVAREYHYDIRKTTRIDALYDRIIEAIKDTPIAEPYEVTESGNTTEAVNAIGDWHIGAEYNSILNRFDMEIASERIKKLTNDTIRYATVNNVKRLHVVNLGDMCEGLIHATCRVKSEMDTAEQIIIASNLIFDYLYNLGSAIGEVVYHGVSCDNHLRMTQNKNDNLESENFTKIMDYYLEQRIMLHQELGRMPNVGFGHSRVINTLGFFTLEDGRKIGYTHGHTIPVNQAYQTFTAATGQIADYILMGHYHTEKMKSFNFCKVYVNGSLKGIDTFAEAHNLFSEPSQLLIVFDGKNDLEMRIKFNA